jgi:small subunit ribosomal protein S2
MLDLREMLKAGMHFGHKTARWCPKMRPFIWGAKNKVHLIDVSKTAILLEKAGSYVKAVAANGGTLLWIGTKKPAQAAIQKIADNLHMPFVINRWVGGTLSNYDQVKKAITRLLHLRDVVKKGGSYYKKKEIVMITKEIARLEKNVGGIIDLEYPPAAIIIVDAKKEHAAVKEASTLKIPIIALVDTNTDPDGVSLIIPANDDSPRSINFVLEYLSMQAQEGKKLYLEKRDRERQEQLDAKKQQRAKLDVEIKPQHKELRPAAPLPAKTPAIVVVKPAPAKGSDSNVIPAAKADETVAAKESKE